MENNNITYGLFLSAPREGSPSFVKGKIGIKVETFINWLKEKQNNQGYVNLDLLENKTGGLYIKLNDYQPKTQTERVADKEMESVDFSDINF